MKNPISQIVDETESACGNRQTARRVVGIPAVLVLIALVVLSAALSGCQTGPDAPTFEQRVIAAERAMNAGFHLFAAIVGEDVDSERLQEWTQRARQAALALESLIFSLEALGVDIDRFLLEYEGMVAGEPEVRDALVESGQSRVFVAPEPDPES